MNCSICNVNKISPEISPSGGFLCGNGHLQCYECNTVQLGLCNICGDNTKFLQMYFNTSGFSLPAEQAGRLPTAPSLSLQSNFAIRELPICYAVFKNYTTANGIQSPIKEEILNTKKNSRETLEHVNRNYAKTKISEMHTAKNFENKHRIEESSQISSSLSRESQVGCAFSKKLIDDVENQSQLNEEHLSMRDSKELLNQWNESKAESETNKCVETLFIGSAPVKNFISPIQNSFKNFNSFSTQNVTDQLSEASGVKKENIFLFEEDPNDADIIKSCEIRFLNSTDSLQNFYSNSKTNIFNTDNVEQMQQSAQKVLTKQNLPDSQADSRAKVENYLQSCDSYKSNILKATTSSNFNNLCKKSVSEYNQETVSNSTESDHSLNFVRYGKPDDKSVRKFKPQEYLVMPAMAVAATAPLTTKNLSPDKCDRPSIDVRMQKLLETLHEQPIATTATEKSNFNKKSQSAVVKQKQEAPKKETQMDLISQLTNVYRAFYNPSIPALKPELVQQEPPLPQFQAVNILPALEEEIIAKKSKFSSTNPVPAYLLNIPRTPIECPDSACQRMIFVSDFNKHFMTYHSQLPMERIMPFQCKNFFLDARLAYSGKSKCHLLYLMRNKITGLGSSEYKDFLPILVMTSCISLNQMCGFSEDASNLKFVLIWLTGIVPEELPISVSLTVWSRLNTPPKCHLVYSGEMYSIRNSQCAYDVWQSGRMLMLSPNEIDVLTNNGNEMLNLQLTAH